MPLSYVVSLPGPVRDGPISAVRTRLPTAKPIAISSRSTIGAHDRRGSCASWARRDDSISLAFMLGAILYARSPPLQTARSAAARLRLLRLGRRLDLDRCRLLRFLIGRRLRRAFAEVEVDDDV